MEGTRKGPALVLKEVLVASVEDTPLVVPVAGGLMVVPAVGVPAAALVGVAVAVPVAGDPAGVLVGVAVAVPAAGDPAGVLVAAPVAWVLARVPAVGALRGPEG